MPGRNTPPIVSPLRPGQNPPLPQSDTAFKILRVSVHPGQPSGPDAAVGGIAKDAHAKLSKRTQHTLENSTPQFVTPEQGAGNGR